MEDPEGVGSRQGKRAGAPLVSSTENSWWLTQLGSGQKTGSASAVEQEESPWEDSNMSSNVHTELLDRSVSKDALQISGFAKEQMKTSLNKS